MPYYCTVPKCTSMAGKVKNVSFHQFPRDDKLALQWNIILKRGKPYTKYSKVCSLHFKPEDYTMTSVGKNKGQWRTLRKDAVPSQNLPDGESSTPQPSRVLTVSHPNLPPALTDPQVQQQLAQAIYVQTMLAIHAANTFPSQSPTELEETDPLLNTDPKVPRDPPLSKEQLEKIAPPDLNFVPKTSTTNFDLDSFILKYNPTQYTYTTLIEKTMKAAKSEKHRIMKDEAQGSFYNCRQCTKYFKDPDVFMLHKRSHNNDVDDDDDEEEPEQMPIAKKIKIEVTSTESLSTNDVIEIKSEPMTANELDIEPEPIVAIKLEPFTANEIDTNESIPNVAIKTEPVTVNEMDVNESEPIVANNPEPITANEINVNESEPMAAIKPEPVIKVEIDPSASKDIDPLTDSVLIYRMELEEFMFFMYPPFKGWFQIPTLIINIATEWLNLETFHAKKVECKKCQKKFRSQAVYKFHDHYTGQRKDKGNAKKKK